MMKSIFLILIALWIIPCFGQHINTAQLKKYCGDVDHCGPYDMLDSVDKILGNKTAMSPFTQVLHIETRRGFWIGGTKSDWGTVSFIGSNTLVTARHVVARKSFLKEICLSAPNNGQDKWIQFKKDEFEVVYYNDSDVDLAVIKILNQNKLRMLYHGSFFQAVTIDTAKMKGKTLNVTGYPCYFANDAAKYDTLINKKVEIHRLQLNESFIAYRIFTCVGDSGAPLWIDIDGKAFIVGIHHGGKENQKFDEDYNMSVRLDEKMLRWLKEQAEKAH